MPGLDTSTTSPLTSEPALKHLPLIVTSFVVFALNLSPTFDCLADNLSASLILSTVGVYP